MHAAQNSQQKRYKSSSIYNGNISTRQLKKLALEPSANALLGQAASRLQLSARSYFKVLRVAQTIADLDSAGRISAAHMAEALQYRATGGD